MGALIVASAVAGCFPKERPGFDAVGPADRLDAIVLAADADDPESLRGLVQQLDSDDPAARLLAIRALQKRTGQTLDYQHDAPPYVRATAVDRWVAWLESQPLDSPPESGSDGALPEGS